MPSPYRLITLDLDETVWPCAPVIRAAEERLHAWLDGVAPRLTAIHDPLSLAEHRRTVAVDRPAIAHDVSALRRESLARLLHEHGYAADLADEALTRFLAERNKVEPFPDVVPALRRLGADHTLVAVTNGNAQVALTPLAACFDLALTAADVGAAKPDPALFHAALAHAGVEPVAALHVGDDPWLDCAAARRAGLDCAWVNRAARPWPHELPPPLLEVRDLAELVAWLDARP